MENDESSSDRGEENLEGSSHSHISMSDTESTASKVDSFHSPNRGDDPYVQAENDDLLAENTCRALVPVVPYHSPVPSPKKSDNPSQHLGDSAPDNHNFRAGGNGRKEKFVSEDVDSRGVVGLNKNVGEHSQSEVKKVEKIRRGGLEEGDPGGWKDEFGGERKSRAALDSILRRSERNLTVSRAAMMLRLFEMVACLISFSVMAADKTRGWSGDSFDRYKEYRYCLAANIIGFVYSGFQAFNLAYNVGTGKILISHHLRFHFDFSMDQLLAYLLMSASTSAATRVDDWITNWGSDKFTFMACTSTGMSFLAFVGFSVSSLISGHNLCNRHAT